MLQSFNIKSIKYRCVKAYLNQQLLSVEEAEEGTVQTIVNDPVSMREKMRAISKRIVESGCSFENIEKAAKVSPYYYNYYNQIGKIVNKYFKAGEEYIPAFLVLETLSIYKRHGYDDFDDFCILSLQAEFERFRKDDKEHRALINKHFECARHLVRHLDSYRIHRDPKSKKLNSALHTKKSRKK